MEEFEVKYLNINPKEIEARLKKLGAKKVFDRLYRVNIFDYPDLRMNAEAAWLRMRDEGDKITLTYKKRLGTKNKGENDDGMKEVEITVNDYEKTAELLHSIGLADKFIEEKRRIRYILKDIEFDIDYMPALDPFLEIEASSMKKVEEGIKLLGLDPKGKKIFSAFQIYELNGINMLEYEAFKFDGLVKRKIQTKYKIKIRQYETY